MDKSNSQDKKNKTIEKKKTHTAIFVASCDKLDK